MDRREAYELWLNSPELTESERDSLLSLTEKEIEECFGSRTPKFGTGGIREIVGLGTSHLNRFTCRWIFRAYAKFLKKKSRNPSAAIVYDNRRNSGEFALIAASVLNEEGIEIHLAPPEQLLSTPFLSYAIRRLGLTGGINITASHNPPKYNGIKMYNRLGKQLIAREESEIMGFIPKDPEPEGTPLPDPSRFRKIDLSLLDEYLLDIKNSTPAVGVDRSFGVLFSSHHGTTSSAMAKMAHLMGFKNFMEFEEECRVTWETNPGEIVNPEDPNSFGESTKEAERLGIDYVFACDPDGDRSAFAERRRDGSWHFFNGNEVGIISSHFKFRNQSLKNPYIVTTYVTGSFVERIFPNIPIHIVPTGFKNISQTIEEEELKGNSLLMAFEESIGSVLTPIHREKDGFQQIALMLEMISHLRDLNLTVGEYLESLFLEFGHCRGFTDIYRVPKNVMERVRDVNLEEIKGRKHHPELGIIEWRLSGENWIKFRYSGTEPKLKVYYNIFGDTKREIDEICRRFRGIIDGLLGGG